MLVFEQCPVKRKISDFRPPDAQQDRQHPTEVECRLSCCPILLSRCRFCSFLKLLSYQHTADSVLFSYGSTTQLRLRASPDLLAKLRGAALSFFRCYLSVFPSYVVRETSDAASRIFSAIRSCSSRVEGNFFSGRR